MSDPTDSELAERIKESMRKAGIKHMSHEEAVAAAFCGQHEELTRELLQTWPEYPGPVNFVKLARAVRKRLS